MNGIISPVSSSTLSSLMKMDAHCLRNTSRRTEMMVEEKVTMMYDTRVANRAKLGCPAPSSLATRVDTAALNSRGGRWGGDTGRVSGYNIFVVV